MGLRAAPAMKCNSESYGIERGPRTRVNLPNEGNLSGRGGSLDLRARKFQQFRRVRSNLSNHEASSI